MKIISRGKASYGIYKVGNQFRVVRNIKDFDTSGEASITAIKLSRGDVTEEMVMDDNYEAKID